MWGVVFTAFLPSNSYSPPIWPLPLLHTRSRDWRSCTIQTKWMSLLSQTASHGWASHLHMTLPLSHTTPHTWCRQPRYRNTLNAFMTISRTEGPRGLFKGLLPTVLTNAPFSGQSCVVCVTKCLVCVTNCLVRVTTCLCYDMFSFCYDILSSLLVFWSI